MSSSIVSPDSTSVKTSYNERMIARVKALNDEFDAAQNAVGCAETEREIEDAWDRYNIAAKAISAFVFEYAESITLSIKWERPEW